MTRHRKKIIDVWSAIILFALIVLDGVVWKSIITNGSDKLPRLYFLNVIQGESALTILPHHVTILTDAGSDGTVADELQNILPSGDDYIDLAIISYPQAADYDGYDDLLNHYQIGAFIYNGRGDIAKSNDWQALMDKISSKHIPLITIGAGDSIHYGDGDEIDILSPDADFARSAEPSDTGIVQKIITPQFSALLASDIGLNVENILLEKDDIIQASNTLRADILKAPFPGLSAGSGDSFLRAVAPSIVVITPGVKNTPSQPPKTAQAQLASSTKAPIISTIASGTIEIVPDRGGFLLYNK